MKNQFPQLLEGFDFGMPDLPLPTSIAALPNTPKSIVSKLWHQVHSVCVVAHSNPEKGRQPMALVAYTHFCAKLHSALLALLFIFLHLPTYPLQSGDYISAGALSPG